jgi:hypothetical protein
MMISAHTMMIIVKADKAIANHLGLYSRDSKLWDSIVTARCLVAYDEVCAGSQDDPEKYAEQGAYQEYFMLAEAVHSLPTIPRPCCILRQITNPSTLGISQRFEDEQKI